MIVTLKKEAQLQRLLWNFYQLQPQTGAETPVGPEVQVSKTSGPDAAVESPFLLRMLLLLRP